MTLVCCTRIGAFKRETDEFDLQPQNELLVPSRVLFKFPTIIPLFFYIGVPSGEMLHFTLLLVLNFPNARRVL